MSNFHVGCLLAVGIGIIAGLFIKSFWDLRQEMRNNNPARRLTLLRIIQDQRKEICELRRK